MEKRVLVLSGLAVLLSLTLLFGDGVLEESDNIFGMAIVLPEGGGDAPDSCPCTDGTPEGSCSEGNPPWYCEKIDGICGLYVACTLCGCPEGDYCIPDSGVIGLGSCSSSPPAVCGDGSCSGGETEISCPADCTSATEGSDDGSDSRNCNDGTLHGDCSLTKPLYCIDGSLIDKCSFCSCPGGYLCEGEICLVNQSVTDAVLVHDDEVVLWKEVTNKEKYETPGLLLVQDVEGTERADILRSPELLITEVIETKDIDEELEISDETILSSEWEIKNTGQILTEKDPDDLTSKLSLYDNVVTGSMAKSIFESAEEAPEFSPTIIECSNLNENCLGVLECCSGLVCSAGFCVSNQYVPEQESYFSFDDSVDNSLLLTDDLGFSNLVDIEILNGSLSDVRIIEYEVHPAFIQPLGLSNTVSFGFYDIGIEDDAQAELSFEILNELLIINQIKTIGLYRLTDSGWESLDLTGVSYGADKTVFTFSTEGFSYFEILGEKDLPSLDVSDETPLWSIYRRSPIPGISFVELLFSNNDRLIFGKMFSQPFIDLDFLAF